MNRVVSENLEPGIFSFIFQDSWNILNTVVFENLEPGIFSFIFQGSWNILNTVVSENLEPGIFFLFFQDSSGFVQMSNTIFLISRCQIPFFNFLLHFRLSTKLPHYLNDIKFLSGLIQIPQTFLYLAVSSPYNCRTKTFQIALIFIGLKKWLKSSLSFKVYLMVLINLSWGFRLISL